MTSTPRVSVVIPTYNSGRYLALTVDSVLRQTMPEFELLLNDDGSSDETLRVSDEYASKDPRVRVIRGSHQGIAGARNRGLAAADPRAEFITFFDHDDVWEAEALESLVGALESNPGCPAAHCVARCIDSDGVVFPHDDHPESMRNRVAVVGRKIVPLPLTAPTSFGAELVKNYVTTPGTSLVRRSLYSAIGGFEPATVPCDDWDMNLRIARRGDFAFVDRILLSWRRHAGATSNLSNRWRKAYMLTRQRSIDDSNNTAEQRELARFALLSEVLGLQREARSEILQGAVKNAAKKLARSALFGAIYAGVRMS